MIVVLKLIVNTHTLVSVLPKLQHSENWSFDQMRALITLSAWSALSEMTEV